MLAIDLPFWQVSVIMCIGFVAGLMVSLIFRPFTKKCPKCHALAEGAICKHCGTKFENPELPVPTETFDEIRKYLGLVANWGKPSTYSIDSEVDAFILPWNDGEQRSFTVGGIEYKHGTGNINVPTRGDNYLTYNCSILEWKHPIFGKCKLANQLDNGKHWFCIYTFDRNYITELGMPYARLRSSDLSDIKREAIKVALGALYAWLQYV